MTTYLDVRTALSRVEQALVDTIQLAYGWRWPEEAEDLEALRQASTEKVPDRVLRFVRDEGVTFRFLQGSRLPHQPPYVIQPSDRGQTGRWLRLSSSETLGPAYFRPLHRVRAGYLRTVELFEGETEEMLERVLGVSPFVLIEWLEDEVTLQSTRQGALYEANFNFNIWCRSENLRPGPQALYGSEFGTEVDRDPGLNRILGDIRYLLADNRLSLGPGVKFCDIQGASRIFVRDLSQRVFIGVVPITVRASFSIPDEDLLSPVEVWIQGQMADTAGQKTSFDVSNFVQRGFLITPVESLAATPDPGVAVVDGQIVSMAPAAHLFEASKDTYRDLRKDGTLIYQSVDVDTLPPAQEPGTLRLAMTRTSATGILSDTYACHSAVNSGDPFRVV